MLASIARTHARDGKNLAFLMGGETVVHLRGKGLGGRNQEIALSAALGIEGLSNALVFSVGSDGTDAGGRGRHRRRRDRAADAPKGC